jgi:metallo-beta-lactamase family protein
MIKIKFCGAAGTVTGSNYLVTTDNGNFVIDCGMFQGPDVEHLNLENLTYDCEQVDFVMLTHAHIDHSGMLPKLYNEGFKGDIYATNNTIRITTELLLDSAKIQELNYKAGEFYGKYTKKKAMVYNTRDAEKTIDMFKPVDFEEEFEPIPGIKVTFHIAGHILGAASIEVKIMDEGKEKSIFFSGDIGRRESHVIDTFDPNFKATPDYILTESLYGGETHPDRDEAVQIMFNIINETTSRNGTAYIPCFAVQRTQELLNDFKRAKENGTVSNDLNVWLDSPLAQRVTRIYTSALQNTADSLFDFPGLHYIKKFKESQKVSRRGGQVIIAGSGMADGGRIMGHLTHALENPKHSIIFVGFQAEGTLGRELTEGAKEVTIGSKVIKVKAKIYLVKGFSAHGDSGDYITWLNRLRSEKLKKIFLIHAEPERAEAFEDDLAKIGVTNTHRPVLQEEVTLE